MRKKLTKWRAVARIGLVVAFAGSLLAGGVATNQGTVSAEVRVAEFLAECPLSHRLPDDPIVLPRLPGASHSHDFFGNHETDAFSTVDTLLGSPGNCNPVSDISSYWVPTLFRGNTAIQPSSVTFYYLGEGVNNPQDIRPTPFGLKIVAGNATATGPADSIARWSCLHHGEVAPSKNFVVCPADSRLETYLDFPQCWDGVNLDSANHKSHMSYPVAGRCPASHPVSVPKLRFVIRYPVTGSTADLRLSSGPGYTYHGDFFNVWPQAEMERRVRNCINVVLKCDHNGNHV